jgi:hypothetical protein
MYVSRHEKTGLIEFFHQNEILTSLNRLYINE